MMTDYHIHTVFCDGKNTPEEIVKTAIQKNIDEIGFSGHSYVDFDKEYSMSPENTKRYLDEISALKNKYINEIKIFCGIEQDYYSEAPEYNYDYIIGSVHYLKCADEYISVDLDKESLISATVKYFSGDIYSLIEEYYRHVGSIVEKTKCNIIGHFDLVEKFNEDGKLFDRNHKRYIDAYKSALDLLLKSGAIFEINTGAVARTYRTKPYPNSDILKYICNAGGIVILSSDCHSAENLCFGFADAENMARLCGFKNIAKSLCDIK